MHLLAQQDEISWTSALLIMVLVGAVFAGAGLLIVRIAQRAADGRLGPNALAGIRTRTTMASAEAWQAAHEAGRRPTVLGGQALIVSAIAGLVAGLIVGDGGSEPERAMIAWTIAVGLGTVLLLGLVIYGGAKGQAAARDVRDAQAD